MCDPDVSGMMIMRGKQGNSPRDYLPPGPGFLMPFNRETRPRMSYERAQHVRERHSYNSPICDDRQISFLRTSMMWIRSVLLPT